MRYSVRELLIWPGASSELLVHHIAVMLIDIQGIGYLINSGVLVDHPQDIADFIHHTNSLDWLSLGRFLQDRPDVLDCLVELHGYEGAFLPDALRSFFSYIPAPNERGRFLETLLDRFSSRYVQCNLNRTTMSKGIIIKSSWLLQ